MEIVESYFSSVSWEDILSHCLRITMVLVLAWIAMKVLRVFVGRLERNLIAQSAVEGEPPSESQKRIETITRLIRQGLLLALWITAGLVILQEIGVEVGPIMASAGIAGVALGFGAQNLVRDVISGFFIILENQIRVGDVAVINGTGGLVEKINFRTTVLRDNAGTVHVFPNGAITTLANMTNEWSAYVFNLRVAYHENVDKVVEVIRSVGQQMLADDTFKAKMLGEPEIFGIDALSDSAIVIQGRLKTKPIRQWDVGREFLRRIKLAFEANGIEIPFPQQTLRFSTGQDALPLQLLAGDAARNDDTAADAGLRGDEAADASPAAREARDASALPASEKSVPAVQRKPTPAAAQPQHVPEIVPPPEPPPQVQTDTEFSEAEAREVDRKTAFKSPPPDGNPS
ncbi:MAG TPA: mechanosensitive ion channel family protein [Pseudomonadales bacterium]